MVKHTGVGLLVSIHVDLEGYDDIPRLPGICLTLNLQSKLVLWGKAMVSSTEPVARVCKDLAHFRADYTGLITDLAHRKFSPVEWKSIYSFNVFDVSKQSKRLKTSTLDIRIKTRFKQNSGAPNVNFFCLPLLGFSNI